MTAAHVPTPQPVTLLFVCTGNLSRSRAAEAMMRAGLPADSGIAVVSAGVSAPEGRAVEDRTVRFLAGRGVEAGDRGARQLTGAMVAEAQLVLTMTREQRSAVVAAVPSAVRRTFTLKEFAGLALLASARVDPGPAHQPARRLLALLSAVPAVRPLRRVDPAADDIADPLEQSDDGHRAILEELAGTVEALVRALRRAPDEQAVR